MNTKNYVKRLISVLICLALVATSVVFTAPQSYAADQSKLLSEASDSDATSSDDPTSSGGATDQEDSSESDDSSTSDAAQDSTENSNGTTKKKKKKSKTNVEKLLAFANKQKGKPYKYGGFGPNSFDCIGFVYYVFANSNAKLKTKMTRKKACSLYSNFKKYIVSRNIKKAKAGDIIVYHNGNKTKHACIAIGNGKCISARRSGGVSVGKLKNKSGHNVAVIRIVKK